MARNPIGLKVSANYGTGKMNLALVKWEDTTVGSIIIDTKQASTVAAMVLQAAAKAYELSGKPPPYTSKDQPIDVTTALCSGWSIAPGRSPSSVLLNFHFGEATLAIPLVLSEARLFAELLLTASTTGT